MPTKKSKAKKPIAYTAKITLEPPPPRPADKYKRAHGSFQPGNRYAIKPGERRNPKGRPPKTLEEVRADKERRKISHAYNARLGDPCDLPNCEGLTWAEAIAKGIIEVAAKGDVQAAKEVREVTEGKVPEVVRLGNENEDPFRVEVENIDARITDLLGRRRSKQDESGGKN